jgi:hypothetical protein
MNLPINDYEENGAISKALYGDDCSVCKQATKISVARVETIQLGAAIDVYETCSACGFQNLRVRRAMLR